MRHINKLLTHSLAYLIAGGSIGSIRKRLSCIVSPSIAASLQPETDEESKKRDSQIDREMMAQNTRNVEDFAVNIAALPVHDIPQVTLSDEAFNSIRFICNGTFSHVYTAMMKSSVLDEQTFQLLIENAKTKASCLGDVLCGRIPPSQDEVCVFVKKIKNECFVNLRSVQDFEAEMKILQSLKHPHIVSIVGHGYDKDAHTHEKIIGSQDNKPFQLPLFQEEGPLRPFLVIEALGGDTLHKYLSRKRPFHSVPFRLEHLLSLSKQFADALKHIHYELPGVTIIHRDLKPDNVGFTSSGTLKLLDFGLSIAIKRGDSGDDNPPYKMTGLTGSMRYMAPEVGLSNPYTEKCDVYSFALILYEMATGVQPYGGMSKRAFTAQVFKGGKRPPIDMDDFGRRVKLPDDVKQLVTKCWEDVPSKRLSSKEICNFLLARK